MMSELVAAVAKMVLERHEIYAPCGSTHKIAEGIAKAHVAPFAFLPEGSLPSDAVLRSAEVRFGAAESNENRANILAALEEAKRCRVPGVTDGIYGIDDLKPFARLGPGVPVIRGGSRVPEVPRFSRAASVAEYRARLLHEAPWLESFDLAGYGLVLAGGAASAILMTDSDRRRGAYSDWDLFLVGHKDDHSARVAIATFGHHLSQAMHGRKITVYRTMSCVTFRVAESPGLVDTRSKAEIIVQIILRRYNTAAEVIHGFDLGSCAVAWTGRTVVLTLLGKLAAEHGINVLNLVVRRPSYEKRIGRYFSRGYDLVLPFLDGRCDFNLPYLKLFGVQLGSCLCCEYFASWIDRSGRAATRAAAGAAAGAAAADADLDDETEPDSDYATMSSIYRRTAGELFCSNLTAANRKIPQLLCARAEYVPDLDITSIEPSFAAADIKRGVMSAFDSNGKINARAIKRLIGEERGAPLLIDTFLKGYPNEQLVDAAVAERAQELSDVKIPFALMGVMDRTALSNPFPLEVVSNSDWFGYKAGGPARRPIKRAAAV
jgi:hypothetical protein